MERQRHGQTAPGEYPASSACRRIGSAPLARLAPTAPAACLSASASPAPGDPDRASSPQNLCFFSSDDLSDRAGALSLIMGRAAGSQCSNGSGGADHALPFRDSRPPGDLSRPVHCLTPPLPTESHPHLSEKPISPGGFFCLLCLIALISTLFFLFFPFIPLFLFALTCFPSLFELTSYSVRIGWNISANSLRMSWDLPSKPRVG